MSTDQNPTDQIPPSPNMQSQQTTSPKPTTPPQTPPPAERPPKPPTPESFTTPHKLLRRNHFWNIVQSEASVTTTHGKGVGPNGRATTRSFVSFEQAELWCRSIWKEKVEQGYVLEKDYVKGFTPTPKVEPKGITRPARKRVRPMPFAQPSSPRGRSRGRGRGLRRFRGRGRGLLRGGVRKHSKGGKKPVTIITDTAYDITLTRLLPGVDECIKICVRIADGGVILIQSRGETGREEVVEMVEFEDLDSAIKVFKDRYRGVTGCDWGSDGGCGWRVVKKGVANSGKWLYEDDGWHVFGEEGKVLERLHAEYQRNAWLRERFVWTCFGGVLVNLEDMTVCFGNVVRRIRRVVEDEGDHDVDGEKDVVEDSDGVDDEMAVDDA